MPREKYERVRYKWRNSMWEQRRSSMRGDQVIRFSHDNRIEKPPLLLYASFPIRFYHGKWPAYRREIDVFKDLRR